MPDIRTFGGEGAIIYSRRTDAASASAALVFEHGHSLRILLEAGAANSAVALLRLQYEALLRAAWLTYAATNAHIEKVDAPLTREAATAAKGLPGAAEMLGTLERAAEASPGLRGLVVPLREIRDDAWAPMNAFVHTGLHAIARTKDGFPAKLVVAVVKMSNAMLHITARLLARFANDQSVVQLVEGSIVEFEDVVPVVGVPDARTT